MNNQVNLIKKKNKKGKVLGTTNHNSFEQNKNAAIIGYWRCGMTHDEIAVVMDMSTFDVERICFNYSKGIK